MKAIVHTRYGSADVLQFKEVEKPRPRDNEALVKVHAAALNASDLEILRGDFIIRITGPLKPRRKILGSNVAGRIERVGGKVEQFQAGDEIWGDLSFPNRYSSFAEYVCIRESALRLKPARMSFEQAAATPSAAVVALQNLRGQRPLQPKQSVLINGAGGGVGTFAVQLAKHFGAEVTGVDSSEKLDFLRSIGADHVIDFRQENFTKSRQRYDLILDVVAYRSIFTHRRALKPNGFFAYVGGTTSAVFQALLLGPLISRADGKKLGINNWEPNREEDLDFLAELFEAGKLVPVIDSRYPLSEVPAALRYLGEGRAKGKVVITVAEE